ncbi:MAG: hypothetical protein LLG14_24255 [Nocardiaceae bacterium]|nr:hypothetical protein [Nocardiaceae bacterium]
MNESTTAKNQATRTLAPEVEEFEIADLEVRPADRRTIKGGNPGDRRRFSDRRLKMAVRVVDNPLARM